MSMMVCFDWNTLTPGEFSYLKRGSWFLNYLLRSGKSSVGKVSRCFSRGEVVGELEEKYYKKRILREIKQLELCLSSSRF